MAGLPGHLEGGARRSVPVTVRLAIAVTHVPTDPRRRSDLISIRRRIPEIQLHIIEDRLRRGIWLTVRAAWLTLAAGGATHGLVLADDMLPARGFYGAALRAIDEQPHVPICFFTMRDKTLVARARNADSAWAVSADGGIGGAVLMPLDLASEFIRWADQHVSPDYPHDDGRLALWCILTGRQTWVTVPSILEHQGNGYSLVSHGGNRVAAWYVDDATSIDWSRGAQQPVKATVMLGPDTRQELARIRSRSEDEAC